jgi:hypothetical protein
VREQGHVDPRHAEVVVLDRDGRQGFLHQGAAPLLPPTAGQLDADEELRGRDGGDNRVVIAVEGDGPCSALSGDENRRLPDQALQ